MDRSPNSGRVRGSPAARFHQQITLRDDLTIGLIKKMCDFVVRVEPP